jgi:competence protein ComEA
MEKIAPWMRWVAATAAAIALAYAFFAPHKTDGAAQIDTSLPAPAPTDIASAFAAPSPAALPSQVAVYVCGAVRKSGVYRLRPDARVVDAIAAAGGMAADADPEAINLAQPLADGMKVDVPKKGDPRFVDASASDVVDSSSASAQRTTSRHHHPGRAGSHKLQAGQSLDVNTATESELTQLPGVGPSLARRIVEYREANGPFTSVDDLQNVSGIGPSKFAKLEAYVRI